MTGAGQGCGVRSAAAVALVAVASHLVLCALLHVLEPQISPISGIISDYAATESAILAKGTFVAFAAVWLSLAIALGGVARRAAPLSIGRELLALAAVSIALLTFVPEVADPRTPSVLAKVGNLVARPGLFLGIVLVSIGLRRAPGWDDLRGTLLSLSLTKAAFLPFTIAVLLDRGWGGVGQRAIFGLVYAWVALVASRLRSAAGRQLVDPREVVVVVFGLEEHQVDEAHRRVEARVPRGAGERGEVELPEVIDDRAAGAAEGGEEVLGGAVVVVRAVGRGVGAVPRREHVAAGAEVLDARREQVLEVEQVAGVPLDRPRAVARLDAPRGGDGEHRLLQPGRRPAQAREQVRVERRVEARLEATVEPAGGGGHTGLYGRATASAR